MATDPYAAFADVVSGPTQTPAPRPQAPARQAPSAPRGIRNNNPGNIEDSPFARSLPGYAGSDGRFARFDSPEAGGQAKARLIGSYIRRGYDTPMEIINRWAPPSDNNPTDQYAAYVAQRAGVGLNDRVTEDQIPLIAQAIGEFETGQTTGQPQTTDDFSAFADVVEPGTVQAPQPGDLEVRGRRGGRGINVWADMTPEERMAIQPGDEVLLPDGRTVTAAGSPYSNPNAADRGQFAGGNLYTETPGIGQAIGAFASAASEQIPFSDELSAATVGALSGIGYDRARQAQLEQRDLLNQTNRGARVAGGLTGVGVGLAAPGGAFIGRGGNLGGRTLRSLGVGAGYGALYGAGAADEGGLGNRANAAVAGGLIGGLTGGAAPAVGSVVSNVSAPAVNFLGRSLNSLSGGRLAQRFAPDAMASRELANALRDDGVTEEAFVEAMNRLRGAGVQPTLVDVLQEVAPNGRAVRRIRGTALHDDASQIATRYARETAEAVPALGQNLTRQLAPNAPPTPAMMENIAERIANALPPSNVRPGSGGEAVSGALNRMRDAAKARVDEAYQAARDLAPERALVPSAVAREVNANVANALSDFDMRDVPSVGRALEGLQAPVLRGQRGAGEVPSVRSLFEVRSRLSQIRANGTPMEQAAAGRAVRSLDDEISRITDNGLIEGDTSAVNAWREANRLRAEFGRTFEGGDLIDRLTARDYRGGGMTNAVAPEDASNLILGQGQGVRSAGNLARDLERLRGMAPDAFGQLQSEAGARLSRIQGERVAPDLDTLRRQNPRLAELLANNETTQRINRAVASVQGAQADRAAVNMGQRVTSATPDEFATVPSGRMLRESTVNRLVDEIGSNPARALNQAAFNPNTRQNLGRALGEDAGAYSDQMRYLGDRLRTSQFINPASGSKTTTASMDAASSIGFVSGLMTGGKTAVIDIIAKLSAGARLSSADRQALVRLGVSEADVIRAAADPVVIGYLVAPTARLEGQIAGSGTSQ